MEPVVIFDLGNVLIRYEPGKALAALSRRARCSTWKARWALGRAGIGKLATGEIDPARFLAEVNRRLGLSLSHDELRDLWALDLPGPVEGMLELLERTRREMRVAILSDTNAFHWEWVARRYPILGEVRDAFLSFREGVTKPDLRFFRRAEEGILGGGRGIITTEAQRHRGRGLEGASREESNRVRSVPGRKGSTQGLQRKEEEGVNRDAGDEGDTRAAGDGMRGGGRAPRHGSGSGRWRIVYFDDRPGNVRAARKAGWEGYLFQGAKEVERVIRGLRG